MQYKVYAMSLKDGKCVTMVKICKTSEERNELLHKLDCIKKSMGYDYIYYRCIHKDGRIGAVKSVYGKAKCDAPISEERLNRSKIPCEPIVRKSVVRKEDIGNHILKLIKDRKISRNKFATAIGVDPSTVHKWVKGEFKPSLKHLIKISETFDVTLDYLVLGKEKR